MGGRQAETGESVLWLLDHSAATLARQAGEEAARLRELIDAIPAPGWRRNPGLALVECNRAYAAALHETRDVVLAEGRELAATGNRKTTEAAARCDEYPHGVIAGF